MRTSRPIVDRSLVWLLVVALLQPAGNVLATVTQPATPGASPAAAVPDGGWPRNYSTPAGERIVLYEPQIASWDDQKLLVLHAAVAYSSKDGKTALLGTIIAEATTRVAVAERLVDFSTFRVTQANFADTPKEQVSAAVAALTVAIPQHERVIGLDRVLAFVDTSTIRPKNVTGVKADPPVVFYSTRTAILVNIDGEPIWSPIENNDLRFAVNTNWDLFEHAPSSSVYLRHGKIWLKAPAVAGPWAAVATLPGSFSKLPPDDNWAEVRANLPVAKAPAPAAPAVFVSTKPAELILLRGAPQYEAVPGTRLRWVRNTEADVFRLGTTGTVYYLVAGRWFSAPSLDGPWTFASLTLPEDFKRIPLEHDRSRVLASVPGTVQAAEAVLLAQVPQTARVSKKEVKSPDVAYLGEPTFDTIETTSVDRATNTDKDIFKVGSSYYMCYQGVWFISQTPNGPWSVTGTVPQEIYQIPVSSPAHHVTYVTVEDDDDEWVTFAAASAYTGVMVAWGCAVWGSGYYYPPYVGYGYGYPVYFPYYPTYGYGAWYNPWTGGYGRGMVAYGPYGGAGVGARYNPRTGTYARGAAAYGPYGARGAAHAYNPRTGTSAATRQGSSVYGSWGSTAVQRGDSWATTSRVSNNRTDTTTRVSRGSDGGGVATRRGDQGGGFVGQTGGGDVYAGRDGNVYRKQGESWQKYDNGSWGGVDSPTPQQRDQAAARAQDRAGQGTTSSGRTDPATTSQLQRDSAARRDGAQRTGAATSAGSGTGARSGSYRPRGGGGGRRR